MEFVWTVIGSTLKVQIFPHWQIPNLAKSIPLNSANGKYEIHFYIIGFPMIIVDIEKFMSIDRGPHPLHVN